MSKKNRPSPSASANLHCGKSKRGNDGRMYTSKRTSRGYCQWKLKSPSRKIKKQYKGGHLVYYSKRNKRRRSRKNPSRTEINSSRPSSKLFTSATIHLGWSYKYAKKTEKFKKPITKNAARRIMKKYCATSLNCFMEDDYSKGSRLIIETGS